MKFAVSALAAKRNTLPVELRNIGFLVEAVTRDEAVGIAHRIIEQVFPSKLGWIRELNVIAAQEDPLSVEEIVNSLREWSRPNS